MTELTAPRKPMPAPEEVPSAEALVRSIGGLAVRLGEVMSKETALLAAGRTPEIAPLQPVKADLARAYTGRWAQLKAARVELAGLAPNLVEGLRHQVARLAEAALENERMLRRVQRAADRVLAIIAQTVREQRTASTGYTRDNQATRHIPGTLGFALDRRF
jgi:flagellar biosynthesis/type III secretory pathway chaperone